MGNALILISQIFSSRREKMKNTDRVSCPQCTMFTWAHDLTKRADGVHVCSGCAMSYVRRAYTAEHQPSTGGLRLVYSEQRASLPAQEEVAMVA